MIEALVATPGLPPALHRELVEHVEVTRRRQIVHDVRRRAAALFTEFLAERGLSGSSSDQPTVFFVLQHGIDAATHAIAFYRPDTVPADRAIDVLTAMVTQVLTAEYDPSRVPSREPA